MAAKTTTIQIRVNEDLKKQVAKILSRMHISMSQAVRMFLRQIVEQGRIPPEYFVTDECPQKAMKEPEK